MLRPASSNASSLLRVCVPLIAGTKDETHTARMLQDLGAYLIKLATVKARLQAAVAANGPSGVNCAPYIPPQFA